MLTRAQVFFASTLTFIPLTGLIPGFGFLLTLPMLTVLLVVSGWKYVVGFLALAYAYNYQGVYQIYFQLHALVPFPMVVLVTLFVYSMGIALLVSCCAVFAKYPRFAPKRVRATLQILRMLHFH